MALVLANRVQESATANTTVSFTLTGAVLGFQTFAVIGDTNTTYYSATDTAGNWEVGLGTYSTTGPTLTRTTIYASSNGGSAVTFPSTVNVFVTYPSGRSVNLNESGNVSALGTVSSGTWQGSTIGVAYGGTGVTSSSGANSVMLRDANQNVSINRLNQANATTTAAGGTTALTAASSYSQTLVGTGNQTYTMPDATGLTTGLDFIFNNNATGTVTLRDYANGLIGTITSGGAAEVILLDNSTVAGTWDLHGFLPEGVTFGTNAFNLGTSVISGGTWQGGTIQPAYGGTGLTTFTGANNALYSTGASTLTAGTLPVAAGGTGATTLTGYVYGNGTGAFTASTSIPNSATTATSANTASAIVARDASGNFSAGTITATLNGNATNVSGIVAVANGGTGLTAGTSGGIPYYSATTTIASSSVLAANALMVGGGASSAPSTIATGTGVVTALGVNTGTAGAFVVNGGALGTPSSGTLSSCSGLPISTGVSGLGTGVATFLATPSSANLSAAVTDETGSGALVFATSPSLTTPALSGETFSTSAAVTAAGTTQGTGTALTSDYNVITTAASGTGVVLPVATTGRRVIVVNRGANAVNVYPASGGTIDALAANAAISLPVNNILEFNASSTTQWYSSANNTVAAASITGTVAVANGGTGQTSYVNGELLIGNTTGNTLTKATLTGTSNQITVTNGNGSITLSTPQSIGTASSVQFGSLGVGTAASGTTGEIRATNNVTAYFSDERLKTRLGRIENALDKLCSLEGFYYQPNEVAEALGYEVHREVGVSAQQVQAVMPEIVAPAPIDDKYLTVRYERALPLLIEAIKELRDEVRALKG